jgi:hypothetical protein
MHGLAISSPRSGERVQGELPPCTGALACACTRAGACARASITRRGVSLAGALKGGQCESAPKGARSRTGKRSALSAVHSVDGGPSTA